MDFGFTNDQARYDAAIAWRTAAIADGWKAEPIYPATEHSVGESMERACKLTRDGFVAQVYTRSPSGRWKFEAKVNAWGPDRRAILVPVVYSWEAIQAGVRTCRYCKAVDVETHLVGFAGRACAACLPEQRRRQECPGWCD